MEEGKERHSRYGTRSGFFSTTPWDHRQLMRCKEALATVADKFLPEDRAREAYVLGHWSVKAMLADVLQIRRVCLSPVDVPATTGAPPPVQLCSSSAHVITWSDWWSERTEGTHHHKSHAWSFRWVAFIVQMYHLLSCGKTVNSQRDRRSINVIFCCYNHTCTFDHLRDVFPHNNIFN
jgi:hypothetical protein